MKSFFQIHLTLDSKTLTQVDWEFLLTKTIQTDWCSDVLQILWKTEFFWKAELNILLL